MPAAPAASLLVAVAGLMGAGGVAVLAAAAHAGGGDMARTAGTFLLIHAGAVLAMARGSGGAGPAGTMVAAAGILASGTIVFSVDLALIGFMGLRPFPPAAPLGGFGMMTGWLLAAAAGMMSLIRSRV